LLPLKFEQSAPVAVTVVVVVVTPVLAKTVLAMLAGLGEFVPIVICLAAVVTVAADVALQAVFPLIDVPVAIVIIVCSSRSCAA